MKPLTAPPPSHNPAAGRRDKLRCHTLTVEINCRSTSELLAASSLDWNIDKLQEVDSS
jgi:hypothetical protein